MTTIAFPDKAARDRYIVDARRAGVRLRALSSQVGISVPRLSIIANYGRRSALRRRELDQRNEQICLAYESGLLVKVIGGKYGISPQAVCQVVKAAGIPLRRSVRRRKADEIRYVGLQL